MSEPRDEAGRPPPESRTQPGAQEPVGSVGDEAAKLLGALSHWARDHGVEHGVEHGADHPGARAGESSSEGATESPGAHGADCRYCPVCQVIHAVRHTSPEVREHLASAAGSLVKAAAGLLATAPPAPRGPVEHIDLDDESAWDEPGASAPRAPGEEPR